MAIYSIPVFPSSGTKTTMSSYRFSKFLVFLVFFPQIQGDLIYSDSLFYQEICEGDYILSKNVHNCLRHSASSKSRALRTFNFSTFM